jgi:regulator of ribonuclease activity A
MDIAIFALGTTPARGGNQGVGESGVELSFGEVLFTPGQFVCADGDGVIVLARHPN